MSQTEYLNTPPMMGPPSGMPVPGQPAPTVEALSAVIDKDEPPQIASAGATSCHLAVGWLAPDGQVVTDARVRELTGYDEERLSRLDAAKNVTEFVTELLVCGVERLGEEKPSKQVLNQLLVGDRDALVLAIRNVTYGNEVDFKLNCVGCGTKSDVYVELDKDVDYTNLEDPRDRVVEVALKHGKAKVGYLTGSMQAAISAASSKTPAEINTLLLTKCVSELNGHPTVAGNEDAMRALSAADRGTLLDWIAEHQPGPRLTDVKVTCGTCGDEYPVTLGLQNLFRF